IPTNSVAAGTSVSFVIQGLDSGTTYYARIWTTDDVGNTSALSAGATAYAEPVISSITLSTSLLNFGSLNPGTTSIYPTPITITNLGNTDVNFALGIINPTVWKSTDHVTGVDTFRLSGIFRNAEPSPSDFETPEDVILSSTAAATSVVY